MDFRTFKSIHRDLERTGAPNLFAYIEIAPTASIRETEEGLDTRRTWAQGQQANPKHRSEAVWFIQSQAQIRQILLSHRADYIRFVESQASGEGLDRLEMFILGALVHGDITPLAEVAITQQAARLGVPEDIASRTLDRLLEEAGLERAGALPDHYAALGVHPHLPQEPLAAYYERRRKWVSNITDREKYRRLSTELEAAWWVLGDPERRKRYDRQYSRLFPAPPPLEDDGAAPSPEPDESPRSGNAIPDSVAAPLVPKLVVDAPDSIQLKPDRQPVSVQLTVRNAGRGEMVGEVRLDQPWASASPDVLDPTAAEQAITITIDPMAMPEDRGEVRVTISTRRCGSRTVVVHARKKVYVKQLLTAGALLAGAALVGLPLLAGFQHLSTSTQTHLVVRADPPTGDVSINGRVMGVSGGLNAHEHFPIDEPFTVRVEADGYRVWEDKVTVPEGELVVVTPRLELTDILDFRPVASDSRTELSDVEVVEALRPVRQGIDGCLSQEAATLRGYVSPIGVLIGLELTSGGNPETLRCLTRQLRAVSFPRHTTSSYSVFEHTL